MPMDGRDYEICLAKQAEQVYARACREAEQCIEAGDTTNAKLTRFRMLGEVIEKIIPHDPFHPRRALSGQLSNIFRVKKGRLRICYLGSSSSKTIIILYISETLRKAGHKTDPYRVLRKMVRSGRSMRPLNRSVCRHQRAAARSSLLLTGR